MKVRKAIIPAAGLGTRFLPATKAQPKEMLPIVDKPTIQYIIEEAVASGIEEILIITGRNKKSIEDHFDKSIELELELEKSGKMEMLEMVRNISDMVDIHYIRQKEPKGLGHAVCCPDNFTAVVACDAMVGNTIFTEQLVIHICAFILCKFHAAVITNSYFFHFKFLQKQKIPIRRKVTLSEL